MADPEIHDEELAANDDAAIGVALKWSFVGVIAIAVIAVGIYFATREPENEIETVEAGPTVLPRAETLAGDVPALPFRDVTSEWGIDFVHQNGATGGKYLPESMGSAVAIFDYDGDGDEDLFFVDGTSWNPGELEGRCRLYRNDGGSFTDVSDESGLGVTLYGQGVAVADHDADGDLDVYLTAVGENRLFRNDGGTFSDITREAGVAGASDAWTTAGAFFDADGDGDLDLFAANYIRWSREIDEKLAFKLDGNTRAYGPPDQFEGTTPYLFLNDGRGRYTEVSAAAGLHVKHPTQGSLVAKSLAVLPYDIDRDGLVDLLVANDTTRNFVFRSKGDGTFEEIGRDIGFAFDANGNATGAMGIDAATYRGDDALGVGIGNFANEMTSLFVASGGASGGRVFFTDEANTEGVGATSRARLSFGLFFIDVDLDGRLDLFQANGHLENEIQIFQPSQTYEQPAQLYWNTGRTSGATFAHADEVGDLATPIVGRGAAYGDLDGDGDDDIVITQTGGAPLVLRNDAAKPGSGLTVRLSQPGANPNALGAEVRWTADGRTERRLVLRTRSYFAQVPAVVRLPKPAVDRELVVRWPDGEEQRVRVPAGTAEFRVERMNR